MGARCDLSNKQGKPGSRIEALSPECTLKGECVWWELLRTLKALRGLSFKSLALRLESLVFRRSEDTPRVSRKHTS